MPPKAKSESEMFEKCVILFCAQRTTTRQTNGMIETEAKWNRMFKQKLNFYNDFCEFWEFSSKVPSFSSEPENSFSFYSFEFISVFLLDRVSSFHDNLLSLCFSIFWTL